jgi:succinate-semialdehyde dehydrogenase/glutarate-semialdehyde dehydrogenase
LVDEAVSRGAKVVTGGRRIGDRGFFYAPTVLTNVPKDAQILVEEPFGPIVPFQRFDSYEDAVQKANHVTLGLAAYAFTGSLKTAQRLSEDIECGVLGINTLTVSMAEAPFGGSRESGYGREGGTEGIDGYLASKFIVESVE